MHKETYTNNPGKNLGKSPRRKPSIDLMCPDLPFVEHILAGCFSMECLKTGKETSTNNPDKNLGKSPRENLTGFSTAST